ncbi:MAG: toll/interleukin-1 receptor domain-containing protein [Bacteroidales bacterium]|jgi:hypothetical protein|nr:toll/interleukin-1 receptor domain-containing protein [Bacteroidales bacterium]
MILDIDKTDLVKLGQLIKNKTLEKSISAETVSIKLGTTVSDVIRVWAGLKILPQDMYDDLFEYLGIVESEIPYKSIDRDIVRSKGNKIFISYSHKDKTFLDRLLIHLKPLEKQGLIDTWVDTRLMAGDKWKKELETALKNAKVGVLLISADFLASDFIIDNELPPLLYNAEKAGTLIIPVILKPCRFLRDKNLHEFQAINSPSEPLSQINDNEKEIIYDSIAQRIEETFEYNG